jgi:hypothetical protein
MCSSGISKHPNDLAEGAGGDRYEIQRPVMMLKPKRAAS